MVRNYGIQQRLSQRIRIGEASFCSFGERYMHNLFQRL
jgi:hypothetical protein